MPPGWTGRVRAKILILVADLAALAQFEMAKAARSAVPEDKKAYGAISCGPPSETTPLSVTSSITPSAACVETQ